MHRAFGEANRGLALRRHAGSLHGFCGGRLGFSDTADYGASGDEHLAGGENVGNAIRRYEKEWSLDGGEEGLNLCRENRFASWFRKFTARKPLPSQVNSGLLIGRLKSRAMQATFMSR